MNVDEFESWVSKPNPANVIVKSPVAPKNPAAIKSACKIVRTLFTT